MTPKEEPAEKECKCLNSLEEICEHARGIRRVVNRILDHLHEHDLPADAEQDYDPDSISWQDLENGDDMYM